MENCAGAVTSTSDLEDGVIDLSRDKDRPSRDEDDERSSPIGHSRHRDGLDQNKNSLPLKMSDVTDGRSPPGVCAGNATATPTTPLQMIAPSLVPPFVSLTPSQLLGASALSAAAAASAAQLPPPTESAYSARRGRILDAPSVPRDRTRSPTPERRVMVRGPSREVLFAKRRIMRARIKTK